MRNAKILHADMATTYSNHDENNSINNGTPRSQPLASISESTSSSAGLEAPSVSTIIRFAFGCVGIWLCGPILSLIDTSAVGLLSGTAQQAALNPAITITDDGALLVSFMYTAATNLVAAAYDKDKVSKDYSNTINTVVTALQLGSIVGIIFGVVLGGSASYFVRILLGKGQGNNVAVVCAAERYVRIRALGMPAAVIIGAAQSACIGMKDLRSPLVVMVAAAFVNLLGDIIFVPSTHPWLGGAAGAAWATVFSQYAAMIMFVKWLSRKTRPDKSSLKITFVKDENVVESTQGILHGQMRFSDLIKAPRSNNIARKFLEYLIPVTTTAVGRVSGYIAMAHVVSSAFGTIEMAAQQIVLAFFLCFIPMCDSLNLTAQSFVPGIYEYSGNSRIRSEVMKKTGRNFLKAGGIFGIFLTAIVCCMPLLSPLFTNDVAVMAAVNSTTPYLASMFALSGIVCSGEGLLLGQKDLKFLSNSFGLFFFVVPCLLFQVKKAILNGAQGIGLFSVWRIFSFYQAFRCMLWLLRLKQLAIKDESRS